MARIRQAAPSTGQRIAVVDDDADLLASVVQLLVQEGHEVRAASSAAEGIALARTWQPHLMLLDYYMPGGTGADAVRSIREFDPLLQVLLVTGYAAEQPARTLLAELDIQGYHDKGDGPQRLLVLIDAALKHRQVLDRMARQRGHLRHILEVSPALSKLQPARDLLRVAISNVGRLLDGGDGFIATSNNGLFVLDDAPEGVSIHAATGQYEGFSGMSTLPEKVHAAALMGLRVARPTAHPDGFVCVPLSTREGARGCMVVEAQSLPADSIEPCELFANQVVQALENIVLYERATIDMLTTLYNRGFGFQRLDEILRLGVRTDDVTSVVMIDIDHFKKLNDGFGHAAGDLALRTIARAVRATCRSTDVVCRYGGEELFVTCPATAADGASLLAEKLRACIAGLSITFEGAIIPVTASFGVSTARHGETDGEALLRRADEALYRAKKSGRNRVCSHALVAAESAA